MIIPSDVNLVSDKFIQCIPRDFARDHLIIYQYDTGQVDQEDDKNINHGTLRLLISKRTDPAAVHNTGVRLGGVTKIKTVIADNDEVIAQLIDKAYGDNSGNRTSQVDIITSGESESDTSVVHGNNIEQLLKQADRDLLSTQGKAPVVKLVDALLFEALNRQASDVHIQPLDNHTIVRYRVDGVLHDVHELKTSITNAVISRIKIMGRMDIAEKRIPQDGRATVTISKRPIDLRISTLPTSYGERAVLRLLDNTQQLCDFDRLGMSSEVASAFQKCATQSNGIILVTGPTGSGKTTTLYSTLKHVATSEQNILTIEDPIEYELSTLGLAISQAQVNARKGITFATGLRYILRQDPDVIMVGEIRDADTARIAIQSSLTGHIVFSTLHTNDAPSAVTRLIDLGVEPYLVSASLSAVLAQRLVRTVHADCIGQGCAACFDTGLLGRTGLFELMVITDHIRELINQNATLKALRHAADASGLRTLQQEGERLIKIGRTTRLEVERVVHTTT